MLVGTLKVWLWRSTRHPKPIKTAALKLISKLERALATAQGMKRLLGGT
jgi:hypothetical protein